MSSENDSSDNDISDYYFTAHDCYKPDGVDPNIVRLASNGSLKAVKLVVEESYKKGQKWIINSARRWTEVQEKWGYDKSWEWFGDTPLIGAARNGHYEIVKYLLTMQADPTLESCPSDDVYETAEQAAKNKLTSMKRQLEDIQKCNLPSYSEFMKSTKSADVLLQQHTQKINVFQQIVDILSFVNPHWKKGGYSGARFCPLNRKTFYEPENAFELKKALSGYIESTISDSAVEGFNINSLVIILKELKIKKEIEENVLLQKQREEEIRRTKQKKAEKLAKWNAKKLKKLTGTTETVAGCNTDSAQMTQSNDNLYLALCSGLTVNLALEENLKRYPYATAEPVEVVDETAGQSQDFLKKKMQQPVCRCGKKAAWTCISQSCFHCCSGQCARHISNRLG